MSKFKVGDIVRRTSEGLRVTIGETYKALRVYDDVVSVENDRGKVEDYLEDYFQLVVPEDPQQQQHNPVSKPSHHNVAGGIECVSDGGPSAYYDFHSGWSTWNDFADYKAAKQWKEHAFHLGNIGKVLCRWGDKSGTTKNYDARKVVYSGLRVLLMLEGKESVRTYLESLLEDGQFKEKSD